MPKKISRVGQDQPIENFEGSGKVDGKDTFVAITPLGPMNILNNTGIDNSKLEGKLSEETLSVLNSEEERVEAQIQFQKELDEEMDKMFFETWSNPRKRIITEDD
jgi:hypothetical protein